MDELQISGKRYISSRRAAQEHGYHADYIGQLVRGGKVAGQKVGRSWYVDAASLAAYLGSAEGQEGVMEIEKEEKKKTKIIAEVQEVEKQEATTKAVEEIKEETTAEEVLPVVTSEEPEVFIEKEIVATPEPVVFAESPREEVIAVEEKEEPRPVVLRTATSVEKKPGALSHGGLRYVADDSPLLPLLATKETFSSKEDVTEEKSERKSAHRHSFVGAFAGLAFLGIMSFGIFFTFSYGLTEVLAVVGENMTSSVVLSLPR